MVEIAQQYIGRKMVECVRIVFKSADEVSNVRKVAVNHFWDLVRYTSPDPENYIPYELYLKADEGDIDVVYVDDPISECSYVIVSGEDKDDAIALIKENTEFWSAEEMFSAWERASTDTEKILALLRIGVGAPYKYDEHFAVRLKEGLSSNYEQVREAALAAIGYRDWNEFDSNLLDVAENDPSENCRYRADMMLKIRKEEREKH